MFGICGIHALGRGCTCYNSLASKGGGIVIHVTIYNELGRQYVRTILCANTNMYSAICTVYTVLTYVTYMYCIYIHMDLHTCTYIYTHSYFM